MRLPVLLHIYLRYWNIWCQFYLLRDTHREAWVCDGWKNQLKLELRRAHRSNVLLHYSVDPCGSVESFL